MKSNSLKSLNLNNLHHAYLVVSNAEEAERSLCEFFEAQGIKLRSSPDFFIWNNSTFGVDDARELISRAIRKAFTVRKVFLIMSEKLTLEAQNALLKTFEDPIPDTHFFLVVREESVVIPTLRSRMQILRLTSEGASGAGAESFLKSPLRKRLDFTKKFVEKELNVSVFLDELLSYLRQQGLSEATEKVYKMRLLSDNRSVSSRLILEHLAVVL